MEVETSTNETIPEVPETETTEEETVAKPADPPKEEEKPKVEKIPIEAPKNNGVVTPAKPKQLSGIIIQFPEMFSLKRDSHFLDKLQDAADIKMQKMAYIECESPEMAEALQAKLNNTSMNGKKVNASRLDCNEKNVLYINGIKRNVTDESIKSSYNGAQKILREGYNTFILFSSETEARAAKTKISKEGINDQRVICEFDNRAKDRFKSTEEPAPKKAKVEESKVESKESGEEAKKEEEEKSEVKETVEESEGQEEEAKEENLEEEKADEDMTEVEVPEDVVEEEVKSDEW